MNQTSKTHGAVACLAVLALATMVYANVQANGSSIALSASSPSNWVAPAAIQMTATVVGQPGSQPVSQVEFYVDGALVGVDSSVPFALESTLDTPKAYALKAIGRTAAGVEVTSATVRATVGSVQWTFKSNPATILAGQSSVLTFTTPITNVHSIKMSGMRPVYTCNAWSCSGSLVVTPTTTTTYTLTSTNDKGVKYPNLTTTVIVTTVPENPTPDPPPVVAPPVDPPPVVDPPVAGRLPRLQKENVVYEGSFALPVGAINGSRFGYGATAMAFDRQTGTLFMVGHDNDQMATEVSIPQLRDPRATALAVASPVQKFFDPTDGEWQALGPREMVKVGGLLPWAGKLLVSMFSYYDANGTQAASHLIGSRNLSATSDADGPYKIGNLKTGYTSGYMTVVPDAWRTALGGPALAGNCCIPIVNRTSFGPALFAFDPDDVGSSADVAAQPLVYYSQQNPLGPWEGTSLVYNGTSKLGGVAFPEGASSVLFFGQHGIGTFCYGVACFPGAGQSPNAPPYISQVWAYDANSLAAVKAGTKQPWEVKPYATWEFQFPNNGSKRVNGVAYDPATQRIFLSQENGEQPLIHVYRVNLP
ncbi:MAG TPA: hypothetical protein VD858_09940 [Reyranella sp.]|nr:hypothetical protein [Reyranella sp.]